MTTERTSVGLDFCVGYTDKGISPECLQPIEDTLRKVRVDSGWTFEVIYVDARRTNKDPASKLK